MTSYDGYNLLCSSDKKGNVWELRKVGQAYKIYKNGRYKTKCVTPALAQRYFLLMLRS